MTTITKLQHLNTKLVPTYGGKILELEYEVHTATEDNGLMIQNRYLIETEMRGLATAEPYVSVTAITAETNNEHTLTADALCDLLEWDCGYGVETVIGAE